MASATTSLRCLTAATPSRPAASSAARASGPRRPQAPGRVSSSSASRTKELLRVQAVGIGNYTSAAYKGEAPAGDDPLALQKLLLQKGWSREWVNTIIDEAKKRKFLVSLSGTDAVIDYLTGLGLTPRQVENICTMCPSVLGRQVSELESVVGYLTSQGATTDEIKALLIKTPRMLVYSVTEDRKQLAQGKARMELNITEDGSRRYPVLSTFRVGSAFETAPLSPWKPMHERK